MANQIIAIGVDRTYNVNFGDLCPGDTATLRLCNYKNSPGTANINICGCDAFTISSSSIPIGSCACVDVTFTLTGLGYPNQGSCYVEIVFGGQTSSINLTWNEVYCDIGETSWIFGDQNSTIVISESAFNPKCDTTLAYCMGQAVYIQRTLAVAQPLVVGDELYLSQWLFAQLPEWSFQNIPVAGWKARICLYTPEEGEPTVDNTYQMEWYGEQPSEEINHDSPVVFCIVSGNGISITYRVEFNLPQDSIVPPLNQVLSNHRALLANTVRNENELSNASDNSIYRNYKYMSWAFVIYRSVGNVYQDDIFSIRGLFPFYGESQALSNCTFALTSIDMTIVSVQPTEYISTTRNTYVRVDFDFADSNTTGTPPTDMWVLLIRNDSNNNQLDYIENYEYEQADLTNLTPSTNITPTTIPTYISGNSFYAEFIISALRTDLQGVENISNNYRLIFVVTSAIDSASRSAVSDAIQLINYSDENLVFSTALEAKYRTVEKEYLPSINVLLGTCVNLNLDNVLQLNLPLLNSQVINKTNGAITTAFDAFRGVTLKVYEESPLTGTTLLNTQFYQADSQNICDRQTNTGLDEIIDRSTGSLIDLTFPMTIPDNVYRKINREGLFQSDASEPTNWSALSLASLNCVQNRNSETCNILFAMPDIAGFNAPFGMTYVPDTNEVWVCDSATDSIIIIDSSTLLVTATINLTVGDQPLRIAYVPQFGCYVTCGLSGVVRQINVLTRAVLASIATPPNPHDIWFEPSLMRLYVCTDDISGTVYEIDVISNTILNSVATGTADLKGISYNPINASIYVVSNATNSFQLIPISTFIPSILYSTVSNSASIVITPTYAYVAGVDDIDIIDITLTSVGTINQVGMGGTGMVINGGIIYKTDKTAGLVRLYDALTWQPLNTYPTLANPKEIIFAGQFFYVGELTGSGDFVRPFLIDCNDSLPTASMANKNIKLNWDMEFQFFDNTEIYTITKEINRPTPSRQGGTGVDWTDIDVYDGGTGTPVAIDRICPTTGQVQVVVTFGSAVSVMGVGVELQPVRGATYSSESSASPILIPVDSPYIYGLTPAYSPTTSLSFYIDTPALPIENDYELLVKFILQ